MDKKFQVFISSTYSDLIEERKSVQQILLSQNCIPAGMENFVAEDRKQLEAIKRIIDLCDYYILIIGGRYGTIDPETGKSYTELEFEYAESINIPILVFAVQEDKKFKKGRSEDSEDNRAKLKAFREKALYQRLGGIWSNKSKLVQLVSSSIAKAIETVKRPGWIRGSELKIENSDETQDYITQIENLKKENEDLKKRIKEITTSNKNLAFENCKYNIRYRKFYRDKYGVEKSKKRTKRTTLSEIFKYISLEMSGYMLPKLNLEKILKDFIDSKSKIEFVDNQVLDTLINQYKGLGLIQQIVDSGVYKYKLTDKGEKEKNKLNLLKK